jgi:hypothetical protein
MTAAKPVIITSVPQKYPFFEASRWAMQSDFSTISATLLLQISEISFKRSAICSSNEFIYIFFVSVQASFSHASSTHSLAYIPDGIVETTGGSSSAPFAVLISALKL